MTKEIMLAKLNEKVMDVIGQDEDNYLVRAWQGHLCTLTEATDFEQWMDDINALAHSCKGRLQDGEEDDCEMEAELDITCQIMDWNEGK